MHIRSILSSSIGNILEWYDFGLFAIFSPLFSQLFFPEQTPYVGMLATFSVFAVGFLCRPIGALLFGYLGDRNGRAKTLRLSILMISLPTLLIGVLPTYTTVGVWAAVLLMIVRIWQGISLGGEFSGNVIYLAETAPMAYRATITSLASTGANAGILLATVIGTLCTVFFDDKTFHVWGWRVPYVVSGVFSIVIYVTRLKLDETVVFDYLKQKKLLVPNPIKTAFSHNLPDMLRTLGLVCMGSTFYYFCYVYIPLVMSQSLGFSLVKTSTVMTLFFVSMLILVPLSGWICDHVGRRKMLLLNASVVSVIVVPGYFYFYSAGLMQVILILSLFTIVSSLEQATTSVAVVENFPPPARYTGLAMSYNVGNGILGGTVPIFCQWLSSHNNILPAVYIMLCAFVTGCVVFLLKIRNINR